MIESFKNPKVKYVQKLRQRRFRDDEKRFLIEGYRELLRASEGNVRIELLFICQELFLGDNEHSLIAHWEKQGVTIFPCSKAIFEKISYRDRPDGLLAVAGHLSYTMMDLEWNENSFILVAESIEKPGNLGTILRSADASGVDALIVCDRCTDIHNPNVVRASVGTLFSLPVIETSSQEVIEWLRMNQVKTCAATPSAEKNYTESDLKGPIAIIVGSEQYGLSSLWLNNADLSIKIPMYGHADSLNVATATTLLLYEVVRQRG
jgi:RNA methyltransferase, TrmH family